MTAGPILTPGDIMACYDPSQLPVVHSLAQELAVCDSWFSSLPGPTWPNRFFLHAASSGGLDHSSSTSQIVGWEAFDGFEFRNGTIFDQLNRAAIPWRIYAGDNFPTVAGLNGITLADIRESPLGASSRAGSIGDRERRLQEILAGPGKSGRSL